MGRITNSGVSAGAPEQFLPSEDPVDPKQHPQLIARRILDVRLKVVVVVVGDSILESIILADQLLYASFEVPPSNAKIRKVLQLRDGGIVESGRNPRQSAVVQKQA